MYDDYSDNPKYEQIANLIETRAKRDRKEGKKPVDKLVFFDLTPPEIYDEMRTKSIYIALSDARKLIKDALSAEDNRLFNRRPLIEADYKEGRLTEEGRDLLYMEMEKIILEAFRLSRDADEKVLDLAVSCMELKKRVWKIMQK